MSEAVDKWKNEIVRNSEILQSHREEIEDMRKDIDLLLKEEFNKQPIEPLDLNKYYKLNLSLSQQIELARILKDKPEKVTTATEVQQNKLNHLRKLFEKLININDQAFACGAMTAREYSRVTKVRKEYEELMEG
jgi:hypothetical protein